VSVSNCLRRVGAYERASVTFGCPGSHLLCMLIAAALAVMELPADAVICALHNCFAERPDLVISGINHGAKYGGERLYSGLWARRVSGFAITFRQFDVRFARGRASKFCERGSDARSLGGNDFERWIADQVLLNLHVQARDRGRAANAAI